jgi:hypothetical protein
MGGGSFSPLALSRSLPERLFAQRNSNQAGVLPSASSVLELSPVLLILDPIALSIEGHG